MSHALIPASTFELYILFDTACQDDAKDKSALNKALSMMDLEMTIEDDVMEPRGSSPPPAKRPRRMSKVLDCLDSPGVVGQQTVLWIHNSFIYTFKSY